MTEERPGDFDDQLPAMPSQDLLEDPEEIGHVLNVMNSFLAYRRSAHYSVTHVRRQNFYAMPSAQWSLLAQPPFNILEHLDRVDNAIDANAQIAEECLQSALEHFGFPPWDPSDEIPPPWSSPSNPSDQGKAYSTIKQLYRDWSAEGAPERLATYEPVLQALNTEFQAADRAKVRVLVPGAGLGRLLFDICLAGYDVEGNEISYHQIIVSNHILNRVFRAQQYTLYPWALGFSNHHSRSEQLQSVLIPDIHPATAMMEVAQGLSMDDARHPFNRMSMGSGDFCVCYREASSAETFEAVTTVFFIDTAPNLIAYIETVRNCLVTNGVWINLGPLLWHFENNPPGHHNKAGLTDEDMPDTPAVASEISARPQTVRSSVKQSLGIGEGGSVELTEEEVISLLSHYGFRVERHETNSIATGYIQNPRSMLQNIYRPSFWIARKLG